VSGLPEAYMLDLRIVRDRVFDALCFSGLLDRFYIDSLHVQPSIGWFHKGKQRTVKNGSCFSNYTQKKRIWENNDYFCET